ncbi:hypothetical protein IE53DRAFT_388852 [Violaceomyces palustris]|uniref:Uncharacterized protein n=1 Tax=Violaceomyces palustris TaxID=1673888 RepID=A0ACD0NT04_9BASI|nr:hypothetical protein IE53DRAFT_388852 [Violaceomyces palustris]
MNPNQDRDGNPLGSQQDQHGQQLQSHLPSQTFINRGTLSQPPPLFGGAQATGGGGGGGGGAFSSDNQLGGGQNQAAGSANLGRPVAARPFSSRGRGRGMPIQSPTAPQSARPKRTFVNTAQPQEHRPNQAFGQVGHLNQGEGGAVSNETLGNRPRPFTNRSTVFARPPASPNPSQQPIATSRPQPVSLSGLHSNPSVSARPTPSGPANASFSSVMVKTGSDQGASAGSGQNASDPSAFAGTTASTAPISAFGSFKPSPAFPSSSNPSSSFPLPSSNTQAQSSFSSSSSPITSSLAFPSSSGLDSAKAIGSAAPTTGSAFGTQSAFTPTSAFSPSATNQSAAGSAPKSQPESHEKIHSSAFGSHSHGGLTHAPSTPAAEPIPPAPAASGTSTPTTANPTGPSSSLSNFLRKPKNEPTLASSSNPTTPGLASKEEGGEEDERKRRFDNGPKGGNRFLELKSLREKLRSDYIASGVLPDPDKPTDLAQAVKLRGTCQDMCPEFEREEREFQKELDKFEVFPGTERVDPRLAVKIYRRPAAGRELPLPEDVRPPHVLKRTLDYLFHRLLPKHASDPGFAEVQAFLWNRTRAIRQDFIVQSESGPLTIECHERIARYHILCLHWKGGPGAEGWSQQQELEQLRKTLRSLIEFYDDLRRSGSGESPNEDEFRAYNLLLHLRDPETLREVELLPSHLFHSQRVQTALKLRSLAQRSNNLEKRGHPRNTESTLNFFSSFFSEVAKGSVNYLMACLAENSFNDVRLGALKALSKAYMAQHRSLPLGFLVKCLGMDDEFEVVDLVERLGIEVEWEDPPSPSDPPSRVAVGVKLQRNCTINEEKVLAPPFSRTLVEVKMKGYTNQDIVDGLDRGGKLGKDEHRLVPSKLPASFPSTTTSQAPSLPTFAGGFTGSDRILSPQPFGSKPLTMTTTALSAQAAPFKPLPPSTSQAENLRPFVSERDKSSESASFKPFSGGFDGGGGGLVGKVGFGFGQQTKLVGDQASTEAAFGKSLTSNEKEGAGKVVGPGTGVNSEIGKALPTNPFALANRFPSVIGEGAAPPAEGGMIKLGARRSSDGGGGDIKQSRMTKPPPLEPKKPSDQGVEPAKARQGGMDSEEKLKREKLEKRRRAVDRLTKRLVDEVLEEQVKITSEVCLEEERSERFRRRREEQRSDLLSRMSERLEQSLEEEVLREVSELVCRETLVEEFVARVSKARAFKLWCSAHERRKDLERQRSRLEFLRSRLREKELGKSARGDENVVVARAEPDRSSKLRKSILFGERVRGDGRGRMEEEKEKSLKRSLSRSHLGPSVPDRVGRSCQEGELSKDDDEQLNRSFLRAEQRRNQLWERGTFFESTLIHLDRILKGFRPKDFQRLTVTLSSSRRQEHRSASDWLRSKFLLGSLEDPSGTVSEEVQVSEGQGSIRFCDSLHLIQEEEEEEEDDDDDVGLVIFELDPDFFPPSSDPPSSNAVEVGQEVRSRDRQRLERISKSSKVWNSRYSAKLLIVSWSKPPSPPVLKQSSMGVVEEEVEEEEEEEEGRGSSRPGFKNQIFRSLGILDPTGSQGWIRKSEEKSWQVEEVEILPLWDSDRDKPPELELISRLNRILPRIELNPTRSERDQDSSDRGLGLSGSIQGFIRPWMEMVMAFQDSLSRLPSDSDLEKLGSTLEPSVGGDQPLPPLTRRLEEVFERSLDLITALANHLIRIVDSTSETILEQGELETLVLLPRIRPDQTQSKNPFPTRNETLYRLALDQLQDESFETQDRLVSLLLSILLDHRSKRKPFPLIEYSHTLLEILTARLEPFWIRSLLRSTHLETNLPSFSDLCRSASEEFQAQVRSISTELRRSLKRSTDSTPPIPPKRRRRSSPTLQPQDPNPISQLRSLILSASQLLSDPSVV